jgi:hypothetical protein
MNDLPIISKKLMVVRSLININILIKELKIKKIKRRCEQIYRLSGR